jgi:hypothetical protein
VLGNHPHDLGRDRRRSLYIDPHQGRVRARCGPCSWFLFGRGWCDFGLLIWTAQEKSARWRRSRSKHPPGPPTTLGNMRQLGVQGLVAYCLRDACRHVGLVDVSSYPADTPVPWFRSPVFCAKCGARRHYIDVRPNWSEQPRRESLTGKVWR